MRAFCDACRALDEAERMTRVEGVWHCRSCADAIERERRAFVSTLPTGPRKGAFYCRYCESPEAMPGHEC